MVSISTVEDQLRRTGHHIGLWGRSEVKELCNILLPGEVITDCVNGHYLNGFAMICATNQRIILVDSKPMFLTVEDIRYDMIAEIDYSHSLLNATVRIFTPTKSLQFTSWNITRMRRLATNAQQHVLAIRQFQNAHSQAFAQNYQVGQIQKPQPVPQANLSSPQMANYDNRTQGGEDEISLASIAINHALTDKNEKLVNNPITAFSSNSSSPFAYPSDPFSRNSFRSRNTSWPRKGLIPRR